EQHERRQRMPKVAQLRITQSGIERSLGIMWIFLLQFCEILSRVLPLPIDHIKATKLKSSLRVNGAAVGVCIETQSVLKIICPFRIALAQLNAFHIRLK